MQPLRLYPEIHIDYTSSSLGRLLFEGVDCYLYVWINSAMELDSFQFVYSDKQVLMFKRPDALSFFEIGREPFSRALSGELSAETKKHMQTVLAGTASLDFSELIETVKELGLGIARGRYVLSKAEFDVMATLRVSSSTTP